MNWIKLEHLLLKTQTQRAVTSGPALDHARLCEQALSLAAGLQARGVLEDQYQAECEQMLYYRETHSTPEDCLER